MVPIIRTSMLGPGGALAGGLAGPGLGSRCTLLGLSVTRALRAQQSGGGGGSNL